MTDRFYLINFICSVFFHLITLCTEHHYSSQVRVQGAESNAFYDATTHPFLSVPYHNQPFSSYYSLEHLHSGGGGGGDEEAPPRRVLGRRAHGSLPFPGPRLPRPTGCQDTKRQQRPRESLNEYTMTLDGSVKKHDANTLTLDVR